MLDSLAHHPDPYPTYAVLRDKGVHRHDDGRWVVARAEDIETVLGSPAAVVGFAADPDDPGSLVQATMARFSDGEDHDRRRALGVAQLAENDPVQLRTLARDLTRERLAALAEAEVEVMSTLARPVPVAALATALGVGDPAAAATATGDLARALNPPAGRGRGDVAGKAEALARLLGGGLTEATINELALLFQASDATAGLIGNALVASRRDSSMPAAELVIETSRSDPPVQLTIRVATAEIDVGGVTIPQGAQIVLLLGAASRTFGAGRRPCPGESHALALATGVVEGVLSAGATLSDAEIGYEPRPNLRIPERLHMRMP